MGHRLATATPDGAASPTPLQRAEAALDLVGTDPRRALVDADDVVAALPRPRAPQEIRAVVVAHRAAGLALRELNDLEQAEARMRRAVRAAERSPEADVAAEARMSLAYALVERGRLRQAITLTTRTLDGTRGVTAHRLRTIRAMALQRSGRADEALTDYPVALRGLRRAGDTLWESRLLNNRGILLATRGDTSRAVADFLRARDIFLAQGRTTDAADVLYNVGYLYGVTGDVPRALEHLEAAAAEWGDLERPEYWAGRAEILTRAGLASEAVVDAGRAISLLQQRGWRVLEAETWLALAAALLGGQHPDLTAAAAAADKAVQMLRTQHRPEWSTMAEYVALTVRLRRGLLVRTDRVERLAWELDERGWSLHAEDLRVATALREHDRSPTTALRLLEPVVQPGRRAGWEHRSTVALARSLRAETVGDRAAAARNLLQAWTIVDDAQAVLGSTELRAGASVRSRHVVDLGLRRSLADGRARDVFDWVERGRAGALRHPPARPDTDPDLQAALTRWRWARSHEDEGRLSGGGTLRDARETDAAERAVRRLVRRQRGAASGAPPARASRVRAVLQDELFLQLFVWRGDVWATSLRRAGITTQRLCAEHDIASLVPSLRFSLRRATGRSTGTGDPHAAGVTALMARLDSLLLQPVLAVRRFERVVVSAPALLAGVPWALCPSLSESVLNVAPSATTWVRAHGLPRAGGRGVVAAAGPGLPSAAHECRSVAALHRGGAALLGSRATVSAVEDSLPGTGILHLAAHGRLRRDNPLFSELALADGPLSGYDIEAWTTVPPTVVLSACGGADEAPLAGDEVLGLAAVVLGAGARTVIAAPVPVPDDVTRDVMLRLHEELVLDRDASAALARCQRSFDGEPPARLVARSFLAVGA